MRMAEEKYIVAVEVEKNGYGIDRTAKEYMKSQQRPRRL
jgi:hypothetical protein